MSVYLDTKYLYLIANKLDQFRKVGDNLYVMRCPFCGDSKKDKTKARGYLYTFNKTNQLVYKCFNCAMGTSFCNLLKYVDPVLYKQYVFERLKENKFETIDNDANMINNMLRSTKTIATAAPLTDSILDSITRVDKLPADHCCVQYVSSRMIDKSKWPLLYYAEDFKQFVNTFKPGKFKTGHHYLYDKDSRLVIPYFDKHGRCFALQGRSLDPQSKIRYYTIKVDEDMSPIYGLERVDYSKQVYCTEGPIDSLFLPNCLAVSGACYSDPLIEQVKTNLIIVPDNERRNKQVCGQIQSALDRGFKVCLWPAGLNFKDINEAIQNGYTSEQLLDIIHSNVVGGLSGRVKFKTWIRF